MTDHYSPSGQPGCLAHKVQLVKRRSTGKASGMDIIKILSEVDGDVDEAVKRADKVCQSTFF